MSLSASLRNSEIVLPTSASAQSLTLQLDVLAQSPASTMVRPVVSAPAGLEGERRAAVRDRVAASADAEDRAADRLTVPAGVAVGSYDVSVQVGDVALKAVIEVKPAALCAFSTCSVDVTPERNHDGTATVADSASGNFDGGGWSYDAALLPAAGPVTWGGITYQAPDPTGTSPNFVEAHGQGLLLPSGQFSWLHVVGSSHNGPVSAAFTVWYTDGTSAEVVRLGGGLGGWRPDRAGDAAPHQGGQGRRRAAGPVVRSVAEAGRRRRRSGRSRLPDDPRVELYALTLA